MSNMCPRRSTEYMRITYKFQSVLTASIKPPAAILLFRSMGDVYPSNPFAVLYSGAAIGALTYHDVIPLIYRLLIDTSRYVA